MVVSTCLIGEDSLLIQCGSLLLSRNYLIKLIVSSTLSIQNWAKEHKIPCVSTVNELANSNMSFDYLFSIVNSTILPSSILQLATGKAINYHDSPLPRYAGLNATSWAIINGETEHGITWHVMKESIDTGDIVCQKIFPVYPTDTALTLNLRCYEYAITSFHLILDQIDHGTLSITHQSLEGRSYFPANKPIPACGFIHWDSMSAQQIIQLHRGLTFGHYDNDLGTLKLLVDNDYLIVTEIIMLDALSHATAGTILATTEDGITIATLDKKVLISKCCKKNGESLSGANIHLLFELKAGQMLPCFTLENEAFCKVRQSIALSTEAYWISNIKKVAEHNAFPIQELRYQGALCALRPSISLSSIFPNQDIYDLTEQLLTAILIYLYRLNNYETVSVSLVNPEYQELTNQGQHLFAPFLPFIFSNSQDFSLGDALQTVKEQLDLVRKKPYFLTDITARHPILAGSSIDPGIVINLNQEDNYPLQKDTLLYFKIDVQRAEVNILHRMDFSGPGRKYREIITNCPAHLLNILIKLINHPHLSVRKLCFLTTAERHMILSWSQGQKRFIPKQSIVKRFEQHVMEHPEKVALYGGDQQVTYYQLNFYAEQIASHLRMKNIRQQTLIGIYIDRGIEVLALILGILKAGCAYVPLDTKYPILKIKQIIDATCLAYIFVQEKSTSQFHHLTREGEQPVECLHAGEIFARQHLIPAANEEPGHSIIYVMFTSGTNGHPKGVVVTQENILNYCTWFHETTQFNNHSIMDFSSSIAFDLSVPCTLAPLLAGGSIAIASHAQKANPRLYLEHLQTQRVTHTELTPAYLEMLLNYPDKIKALVSLRYLLLGAETVPSNEVLQWLSLCPWHQIINEYGPTETTVAATSYFVDKKELKYESSVPIGRPAFNTSCYILDKYKNFCPVGVKGELHIGGPQVTQGYLNHPELNREKFITVHFANAKETVYKTGDVACWLSDRNLQFFGRNDHQVKIQGYRIELPMIEAVLTKIPGIHQALVVRRTGALKESYLRAYLVMDNFHLPSSEIRNFLLMHLPPYMVPREFCAIQAIPLKENEKIDFTELEQQSYPLLAANTPSSDEYHATLIEQKIITIWKKVFHAAQAQIDDDFFALGGDSLMAMQLISELKTYYGMQLPLQLLFEHPTIAGLAKQIEKISLHEKNKLAGEVETIIKLADGKEKIPLFLVHPVGGSVFWYKQLASCLQGEYTVYGIQDISVEGIDCRFNTLEDMATYYLNQIATVYSGPVYHLGGASFGATVAFEMAHQLRKANKQVLSLHLFDGWAHYPKNILQEHSHALLKAKEDPIITKNHRKLLSELEVYRKELLAQYRLSPLSIDATLFKATELWPEFIPQENAFNGWTPYIKGVIKVYQIPGNHETMFYEPYVRILASCLSELRDMEQQAAVYPREDLISAGCE